VSFDLSLCYAGFKRGCFFSFYFRLTAASAAAAAASVVVEANVEFFLMILLLSFGLSSPFLLTMASR
jgi:hypothetical protein